MNQIRVFVKSFGCSTNLADGEVLAGCLAEAGHQLAKSPSEADIIIYNTCAVKGPTENRMIEISLESLPALDLPRIRVNRVISIVPINYGCLGSCAYCCVTFARGKLRSYPLEEIVERVKNDLKTGIREFWLTSQDTACYGDDKRTSLAELLDA